VTTSPTSFSSVDLLVRVVVLRVKDLRLFVVRVVRFLVVFLLVAI
jgi:hypothetical protein